MNLFARQTAALLALALAAPLAACAQSGFGPLDPAPPKDLSVDQIIKKFGEREAEFRQARDNYTFRQSVKIDTIDDDSNKVDGEYQQVTDIVFDKNGKREEHVVFAPQNTLERVIMTPADFDEIEHRLPFILTTEDLPNTTSPTSAARRSTTSTPTSSRPAPRSIEKNQHYFQGKVWVDQQDLQIVLVNGKTVPQDIRPGHEDLQPPFTTYYEQVDGKYWFPTYTKAEGELHFAASKDGLGEDIHMRSVVKYTDYKQFRATSRIIYDGEDITNKHTPDGQAPAQNGQPATPPK